jgi:hypothetical protein
MGFSAVSSSIALPELPIVNFPSGTRTISSAAFFSALCSMLAQKSKLTAMRGAVQVCRFSTS